MSKRVDACSRCHAKIELSPPGAMTIGYYNAWAWSQFTEPTEMYICDACMFADPRYIAVYGDHRA